MKRFNEFDLPDEAEREARPDADRSVGEVSTHNEMWRNTKTSRDRHGTFFDGGVRAG